MRKSIILDIFSGRYEGAGMPPPKTKSYKTNARLASKYHSELMKHLSPDDQVLLDKYINASERVTSETIDHFYREGFSVAFRILIEAIGTKPDYFEDDYEEDIEEQE